MTTTKHRKKTIHDLAIANLRQHCPSLKTTGFKKSVLAFFSAHAERLNNEDIENMKSRITFIPDLYHIDHDCDVISIYEVEDSSALTPNKLNNIMLFWWECDAYGVDVKLFVLDRYGANKTEIDIFGFYWAMME